MHSKHLLVGKLQARTEVEARAVELEGDDAEHRRPTEALVKVPAIACQALLQSDCAKLLLVYLNNRQLCHGVLISNVFRCPNAAHLW